MNKKTFILLIAFILCGSFSGFSQNKDTGKDVEKEKTNETSFAEAHLKALEQYVQLTDSQKVVILEIGKTLYNNRQVATSRASSREQIKDKQRSYEAFETSLENVLTPEQLLQLRQKQAEQRDQRINEHLKNKY
jgi:hypothetical protein